MILGDSLLVMNSLLEKEGMRGRVQTIYLDPPTELNLGPTGKLLPESVMSKITSLKILYDSRNK